MKNATEQNDNEVNDSIENSPAKINIRTDLINQTKTWIEHDNPKKIIVFSLPAKKAYFERALDHAMKRANIKTDFRFYGVEKKKKIALMSFKNMPSHSVLAGGCTLEEFLDYEHRQTRTGFALLTNTPRIAPFIIDFGWFDYCCIPTVKNITHFVDSIENNCNKGIMALTFDLSVRKKKQKKYARQFMGYKKGYSLQKTVVATIAKLLKSVDKKVELVYNVVYGGGKSGRTTMLTLAYSVNLKRNLITPIEDNFRDETVELSNYRANTFYKFKKMKKWKFERKGRKAKVKKVKIPLTLEEKAIIKAEAKIKNRVRTAVTRWEPVWGMLSREKKIKIASKYGVTLSSFSSTVATRHGKFKAKKEAKLLMFEKASKISMKKVA